MISIKSNTNSTKDQSALKSKSDQADGKKNAAAPSATSTDGGKEATSDGKETDKYSRFENEGVVFKAKLIGSELVMEPRGDKMCQNSIQRLKAIIKGTNSHKRRIVLKISYDGVKVYDEKTNEILHHHEVSQISYIASDDTDNRTFGYVSDVPSKAHQFICFKTSGPAINVMSVISSLFEAVLEKKNQAEKLKQEQQQQEQGEQIIQTQQTQQDSMDLIGDSGIMDNDASVASEEITNSKFSAQFASIMNQQHQQQQQQQQQHPVNSSSSILDNLNSIGSLGNSFSSSFNASNNNNNNMSSTINNNINANRNANDGSRLGKQSASTDLIFDDLFAGISDPIIVDKNESFISYSRQQQNQQQPPVSTGGAMGGVGGGGLQALAANSSGNFINPSNSLGSANFRMAPPPRPNDSNSHLNNQATPSQPIGRPIPRRQHSQQHPGFMPPPSSLPRLAPMMNQANQGASQHNRSLVYNHSSVSLSDAALTRQTSFNQNDGHVDRYAVFNDIDNLPSIFESASLGTGQHNQLQQQLQQQQQQQQYQLHQQQQHQQQQQQQQYHRAMGNSMGVINQNSSNSFAGPSFAATGASASSSSTGGLNRGNSTADANMFRQTNPFDDDFFA